MIGAEILSALVDGLLMGLVYASLGLGLGLVLGILNNINVAHGSFVMLGSFFAYEMLTRFNIDPVFSLAFSLPLFFGAGTIIYRLLSRFTQRATESQGLLAMFGLMILIESLGTIFWTNDSRVITLSYSDMSFVVGGITVAAARLVAGLVALFLFAALWGFLRLTLTGRAIRAIGQNSNAAAMLGIDVARMSAYVFGIGLSCAAAVGTSIAIAFPFAPNTQVQWLPWAFLVAVAGSMDVAAMFCAGIGVGWMESLCTLWLPFEDVYLILYVLLGLLLVIRRQGLSLAHRRTF